MLEDGRLTDGKGRVVDFSNAMLIMTSNVGSRAIVERLGAASASGGSGGGSEGDDEADFAAVQQAVRRELQEKYRPEVLNRLDEIVTFRPLKRAEVEEIAEHMVASVAARARDKQVEVTVTPALRDLAVEVGFSPRFGARPLRRAVQRLVEDPLAEALLAGFAPAGSEVTVDVAPGGEEGASLVRGAALCVDVAAPAPLPVRQHLTCPPCPAPGSLFPPAPPAAVLVRSRQGKTRKVDVMLRGGGIEMTGPEEDDAPAEKAGQNGSGREGAAGGAGGDAGGNNGGGAQWPFLPSRQPARQR